MEYTDPKLIVPPQSLDELIQELHKIFSSDKVNVEYVQALMTAYKSNPKHWTKYAHFDPHRYTRNLVDKGNGKFNLIVLCWNEGQGSGIHDHSDAHCFAKVLDGELNEILFDWPKDGEEHPELRCRKSVNHKLDSCSYINDSIGLHRVENANFTDVAVSLHLYSPPFDTCACFDERSGHKTQAKVTFWTQYGERTPFKPASSRSTDSYNIDAENN